MSVSVCLYFRLIDSALELAMEQQLIIQGNDRMTSNLQSKMENVTRLVQGIKEVAWSDEGAQREPFDLDPLPAFELVLRSGSGRIAGIPVVPETSNGAFGDTFLGKFIVN